MIYPQPNTIWSNFVTYLNRRVGKEITRKQFMNHFGGYSGNASTGMNYHYCLTSLGYLRWVKPCVYKVVKKIPTDLTAGQVQGRAKLKSERRRAKEEQQYV